MNVTHIAVYQEENDLHVFPCSNLEKAREYVEVNIRFNLGDQGFFFDKQEIAEEIFQAFNEERFADAVKLYHDSQCGHDGRFVEQFFIHPIVPEEIDVRTLHTCCI
jgi:hypothetical protein